MTIKEAIAEAKATYNWSIVDHEPTSVNVGFYNYRDSREDESQYDLYDDFETELEELWNSQYKEMDSKIDAVLYVEALGYIQD